MFIQYRSFSHLACPILGVSKYALTRTMTMPGCNMGHSAYALTLDRRKTVRQGNVHMAVQVIIVSNCVEDLDTSIFSTLMHTKLKLTIWDVETRHKIYITKNGMQTWVIVV